MQTSGLVLDIYDDFKGDVVRSIFPTAAGIPDFIKQAQALSSEDRERLPDDAFALVMIDGENTLRKFACIDEGGTALSVQFFLKNAHKLPPEVQKVAAQNLVTACGWYDLAVPSPLSKIADVTGTSTMPYQTPINKKVLDPTVINKTSSESSLGRLVPGHKGEHDDFGVVEGSNYSGYTKGKNIEALPQARQMKPHVFVASMKNPTNVEAKEASAYALPSQQRYPLDSYVQVKTASQYFDDFYKDFAPEDRHEYAMNLVKRANEIGLSVSAQARRYGASTYASDEDIKVAYEVRDKTCGWDDDARAMLHELFEKRAELEPEVFARALTSFDKTAGINHEYDRTVPDAYFSTFGDVKLAEEKEFTEIIGNDFVTGGQLAALAKAPPHALIQTFDPEFCKEFRKDPVGIFKSMPVDQKKILARMAAEAA